MKNKKIHLLFWIFIITVTGCSLNTATSTQLDNPDLICRLNAPNFQGFPERFNVIHHTILNLAGKSYVLNGYLKIDRLKQTIRFNAQSELGGTVFSMLLKEGNPPETDIQLKQFRKEWLEKSVALDLKNLYLDSPFNSPELTSVEPGELILSNPVNKKQSEEKVFTRIPESSDYRIKTYQQLKNGIPHYSITYYYGIDPKGKLPESFTLVNKRMHYTLKVKVLYL